MSKFRDVDAYIAAAPNKAKDKLAQLRTIVMSAAPEAEEGISYDMPYYNYHGPLVGFAAYKNHVSLFGSVPQEYRGELTVYKTSKGTIRFPLDEPLPIELIKRIVKARMRANETKKTSRVSTK